MFTKQVYKMHYIHVCSVTRIISFEAKLTRVPPLEKLDINIVDVRDSICTVRILRTLVLSNWNLVLEKWSSL